MHTNQQLKFEVPFNGDDNLVSAYADFKERIVMVYGRAEDGYPQGRKTDKSKPITLENIFKQAETVKKWGVKFNYLINGTSFSNREFSKEYRRSFVSFVKNLASHGVNIVTIGNLHLLEIISNEVPEIEIFASVLLEVDCLARLKAVSRLGPKYVCLSKTLLKNFRALENIGKFCVAKIEPILLSNDPCLHHCVFTHYHNDILSHLTGEGAYCDSYCRLHCTKAFIGDRRNLVSASFIRPEDLRVYFNLGYRIFKLCDRKHSTEWIMRALRAYSEGYYNGNLADIMAPWNRHSKSYSFPTELSLEDFVEKGMDSCRDHLRFTPYIENRKLDGYLEHWRGNKQSGCRDEDCDSCGYCAKLAAIATEAEPLRKRIIAQNIEKALKFSMSLDDLKREDENDRRERDTLGEDFQSKV